MQGKRKKRRRQGEEKDRGRNCYLKGEKEEGSWEVKTIKHMRGDEDEEEQFLPGEKSRRKDNDQKRGQERKGKDKRGGEEDKNTGSERRKKERREGIDYRGKGSREWREV